MDSNRDSFNRFGTELSQIILSYLPLNEKFGFECVSKRWQRLIYNKVTKLDISLKSGYTEGTQPAIVLKRFLNKLKFVEELEVEKLDPYMVELIFFMTENIKVIRFSKIKFNLDLSLLWFKYKKSLTAFEFKKYMALELSIRSFAHFIRNYSFDLNLFINQKFENLREMTFSQPLTYNMMRQFSNSYCSQIIKLSFYFTPVFKPAFDPPFGDNQDMAAVMRQIIRYRNLKSLNITMKDTERQFGNFLPSIERQISIIGDYCQHIQHLGLCFGDENRGIESDIFVLIQNFNSLISLSLEYNNSIMRKHTRSESVMNSLKLKHLRIKNTGVMYENKIINNLQPNNFNDYLLKDIAGLKHLSKLVLSVHNITDYGICYLIRNLPKLSTIHLNNYLLTQEICDCLIRNAVRNPKLVFEIRFRYISKQILIELPNNLIIKEDKFE